MDLLAAVTAVGTFTGDKLTARISNLEKQFRNADKDEIASLLSSAAISHELLSSAHVLKSVLGQVHVVIHAIGILLCLPHILNPGERIQYLSLGAGNSGRPFDLETNLAVAEFKFIYWQGGSEAIRQNALFKDFYLLAEHRTRKHKRMYVLGVEHPLRFLNGRRSISSVLSRNRKLWAEFVDRYGDRFHTVNDYYTKKKNIVKIEDLGPLLPSLVQHVLLE